MTKLSVTWRQCSTCNTKTLNSSTHNSSSKTPPNYSSKAKPGNSTKMHQSNKWTQASTSSRSSTSKTTGICSICCSSNSTISKWLASHRRRRLICWHSSWVCSLRVNSRQLSNSNKWPISTSKTCTANNNRCGCNNNNMNNSTTSLIEVIKARREFKLIITKSFPKQKLATLQSQLVMHTERRWFLFRWSIIGPIRYRYLLS